MFCLILSILLVISTNCDGLKILIIVPFHGRSQIFPSKMIAEGLANRGHEITFISASIEISQHKNLKIMPLPFEPNNLEEQFSFDDVQRMFYSDELNTTSGLKIALNIRLLAKRTCEEILNSAKMRRFKEENRSFDLIILGAFHTDCFAPFAHYYQAHLVLLATSTPLPWYYWKFGQPANPSYVPSWFSSYTQHMSFCERLQNTIIQLSHVFYYDYIPEVDTYKHAKLFFGDDIPELGDIIMNSSLLLTNSHFTHVGGRANVPGIIEVGGIHLRDTKLLPINIEKWINESKDGVIYFSMGSMIKGHTFPEEKRKVFLRAFDRLKQRVLWKWENETMLDKPDNVMIQKWMPQFDILSHPNVKAFISHGGLLGTTEAVHCGVPVVVMPQFGDQHTNARALEAGGGGVVLNFREADEEMVYNALKKVLDPEFNKKAKELSARFRDRPMSPMDTAIYWIEYVARHKGAHHLRTAAVGMPLYQYLLLDVFGFFALCVLSALFVAIFIAKMLLRFVKLLFSSGDKKQKKQKKQ